MDEINWFVAIMTSMEFLASVMYFKPYSGKSHTGLRLLLTWFASVVTTLLLSRIHIDNSILTVVRYLIYFALIVLSMKLSFHVSFEQALFGAAAGRVTQHFVSNFVCLLSVWYPWMENGSKNIPGTLFSIVFCYLPWYAVAYYYFARNINTEEYDSQHNRMMKILSVWILFVTFGISRFAKDFNRTSPTEIIAESLYAMTCCALALVVQFEICRRVKLAKEIAFVRQLWHEDKRHLTENKSTIEIINIKCHDLRHRFSEYAERFTPSEQAELEKLINIYDTTWDTGNATLDVILTNIGFLCVKHNVQMTFMGRGGSLAFLSEMEIYSLIGNAVSNAVEAVKNLEDKKRRISIVVKESGNFVSLSVLNYYDGVLNFIDGLPDTTHTDDGVLVHGFGMKSMRLIAQKHGGDIEVTAKDDIFELNIWMLAE